VSETSLTTGCIADRLGARLVGPADVKIDRIEPINEAQAGSITFVRSASFLGALASSRASAAVVAEGLDPPDREGLAVLFMPDADLAMIELIKMFIPEPGPFQAGIHPSSVIDPTAEVDPGARVGPLCTIGPGATVGAGTVLISHVFIGARASVGSECVLHPQVCVRERCRIGDRSVLHAGAVIGGDGFAYRPAPDGGGLIKVPQVGTVEIGSDVEIGAGSCVDRGTLGPTRIGDGTKIDNLVQIGHNCQIGRRCVICGCCGLSGSVRLGDGVTLAGQVGVVDGTTIGDGATIGSKSGVLGNVPAGATWWGYAAGPVHKQQTNYVALRNLAETMRDLKRRLRLVESQCGAPDTREPTA